MEVVIMKVKPTIIPNRESSFYNHSDVCDVTLRVVDDDDNTLFDIYEEIGIPEHSKCDITKYGDDASLELINCKLLAVPVDVKNQNNIEIYNYLSAYATADKPDIEWVLSSLGKEIIDNFDEKFINNNHKSSN